MRIFVLMPGKGFVGTILTRITYLRLHYRPFYCITMQILIELLRSHKGEFHAGIYIIRLGSRSDFLEAFRSGLLLRFHLELSDR